MSFCKDCVRGESRSIISALNSTHQKASGVRWEGTPEGKIEKINGVDAYVATPTQDYPKDKVLLLLTDIFGVPLVNTQVSVED